LVVSLTGTQGGAQTQGLTLTGTLTIVNV